MYFFMSKCLCISLRKLTSSVFFHVKALVAQSCPTLCHPVDFSPPGYSVRRLLQARTLEWESFPSPGDLPNSGIEPLSPALHADSLPLSLSHQRSPILPIIIQQVSLF